LFDHGVLEKRGPEVGDLRGVVDLEDVELLSHRAVKLELLSLEGGDNLLSQVNSDEVLELGHLHDLTLGGLDGVGEGTSITGVLEESSHGGLTSVEVVKVGLGGGLLLDELHLELGDLLSSNNGRGDSLKI